MATFAASALTLAVTADASVADPSQSGRDYIRQCTSRTRTDQISCLSYTKGIVDGLVLWMIKNNSNAEVCIPTELLSDHRELSDLAIRYILKHPKEADRPARDLLMAAYREIWRCEN
jgi:hypothetical protein